MEALDMIETIRDVLATVGKELDQYPDVEASGEELVAVWLALKGLTDDARLLQSDALRAAHDRLDGAEVTYEGRTFTPTQKPHRSWTSDGKSRLRDQMVRHVAHAVALDPLTGELDSDRARVAHETIRTVEQWHTLDASKFKQAALKPAGLDLGEFCEATEWRPELRESR